MACFLVPTAEAVVVTIVEKVIKDKEKKLENIESNRRLEIPFSRRLSWLRKTLWGGSILLAYEHLWHGEIVLWYPFLTAMQSQQDMIEMFREISTIGVGMAVLVTVVWYTLTILLNKSIKHRLLNRDYMTEIEWEGERV